MKGPLPFFVSVVSVPSNAVRLMVVVTSFSSSFVSFTWIVSVAVLSKYSLDLSYTFAFTSVVISGNVLSMVNDTESDLEIPPESLAVNVTL